MQNNFKQAQIQKVVPVKKNGYILELQVPPPGAQIQTMPILEPQVRPVQVQNIIPPQALKESISDQSPVLEGVDGSSFMAFRNFFKR